MRTPDLSRYVGGGDGERDEGAEIGDSAERVKRRILELLAIARDEREALRYLNMCAVNHETKAICDDRSLWRDVLRAKGWLLDWAFDVAEVGRDYRAFF
eukprot:4324179-Prymnesium_polylepis.2